MANNNEKFVSRENAKTLWGYMIDLLTGKQNKLTFDDTPTSGSSNPVKSGGIFAALSGKGTYSKPQNGIPKTDLESAVQTSLNKADTALQSETDPTVPSWAKATDKPSYNSDEISDTNRTHKFITAAQLVQIDMNKTNIAFTLNRTGKNLAKELPTQTVNGVTLTNNGDGTYYLSRTSTGSSTASFVFGDNSDGRLTGCKFMGGATGYGLKARTSTGTQQESSTDWTTAKTIPDTATGKITVNVDASENPQNVQIRPFICDADVYDVDPTFTKPALPNRELTILEEEDRAELVELVDRGAKNKLNYYVWKNVNVSNGTAVWENNGVTLTATGDDCYTAYQPASVPTSLQIPVTKDDTLIMSWDYEISSGITAQAYIFPNGQVSGSVVATIDTKQLAYTVPSGVNYVTFRVGVRGAGNVAKFKNVMICTKAAWDVSQKFVPYYNPASPVLGGGYEIPLNSSMDRLTSIGKWRCYNSDVAITVTNAPFRNGFFGWTTNSITDATRYVQIAISNADVFEVAKRRWNGTIWSDWEYISSSAVTRYKADTTTTIGTDWTLTSIVLQAPVDSLVFMTVVAIWGAKAPRGIRITRTNTSATNNVIATIEVSEDKGQIQASGFGVKLNGVNTYYVWAKAKESGTMPVYLTYSYPIKD